MRGIRPAVAAATLAVATLAPVPATAAAPAAPPAGSRAPPAVADVRACGALPKFPKGTVAQLMAGRLRIAPFKAVTVDPRRDGDVDWSMDPYHDPTWVLEFQTGTWIEALVRAYLAGGRHAAAYRDRAQALLAGWLGGVPLADQNPETLMCSAEAFPGQAWIHDRIPVLLDYYAAHWQGAYNHGLSQDLELLRAGCLPRQRVGRHAGFLAADRQAAADRVLPAHGTDPPRRPGRDQRAGDRVRQLHVRPVDYGGGQPSDLPPAGAATG